MAYLAVDKDDRELMSSGVPIRDATNTIWLFGKGCEDDRVLEDGSIAKLISRKLSWADEPFELKGKR